LFQLIEYNFYQTKYNFDIYLFSLPIKYNLNIYDNNKSIQQYKCIINSIYSKLKFTNNKLEPYLFYVEWPEYKKEIIIKSIQDEINSNEKFNDDIILFCENFFK
jgi:hypothetical protein